MAMLQLGEVTWLLLNSPGYRDGDLRLVEEMFLRPLLLDQLRVYRRGSRPVGLASWAWLGPDAEARYLETGRLEPEDWQSGSRLWFTDFLAPFGDVRAVTAAARAVIPAGSHGFGTRRNSDGSIRKLTKYAALLNPR
jgi:cytolysin-activating lysine-acyltransferase